MSSLFDTPADSSIGLRTYVKNNVLPILKAHKKYPNFTMNDLLTYFEFSDITKLFATTWYIPKTGQNMNLKQAFNDIENDNFNSNIKIILDKVNNSYLEDSIYSISQDLFAQTKVHGSLRLAYPVDSNITFFIEYLTEQEDVGTQYNLSQTIDISTYLSFDGNTTPSENYLTSATLVETNGNSPITGTDKDYIVNAFNAIFGLIQKNTTYLLGFGDSVKSENDSFGLPLGTNQSNTINTTIHYDGATDTNVFTESLTSTSYFSEDADNFPTKIFNELKPNNLKLVYLDGNGDYLSDTIPNVTVGDSINVGLTEGYKTVIDSSLIDYSVGGEATFIIKTDGTLWAVGKGSSGRLGLGNTNNALTLTQVGTYTDWAKIDAQWSHVLAIKSNGTLWGWGYNNHYQVKSPSNDVLTPTQIGTDTDWANCSTGFQHSIAIKSNGTLYTWGVDNESQLGQGTINANVSTPTQVGTDTDWEVISGGYNHTMAIKTNGDMYTWGGGSSGQLGDGAGTRRANPTLIGSSSWSKISAGSYTSAGILSNGSLLTWGDSASYKTGTGDTIDVLVPTITLSGSWLDTKLHSNSGIALKDDGTVYAWGVNTKGPLGDGTFDTRPTPIQISTEVYSKIDAGNTHTLAIKSDDSLFAWGDNTYGQLMDDSTTDSFNPVQKVLSKEEPKLYLEDSRISNKAYTINNTVTSITKYTKINVGSSHVLALKENGIIYTWGNNNYGQLGNGDNIISNTQLQLGSDNNWTDISVFAYSNIALKSDGTIWVWGANDYGQLADGTVLSSNIPLQVGTDTNWSKIISGYDHFLAIKSDGTLWGWGRNQFGALGLGDTSHRDTPTQIGTDTDWDILGAGGNHSLVIKSNGTLWVTGYNGLGQLGLGDNSHRNIFTQIGTDTDWINAVGASTNSFFIKSTGQLFSTGINDNGQLGLGDNTNRNTITQVGVATDWDSISSYNNTILAIRNNGELWGWGGNNLGNLGIDGDTINKTSPTRIGTDVDWLDAFGGSNFSVATKDSTNYYAWGENSAGQLGQGDNIDDYSIHLVSSVPNVLNINSIVDNIGYIADTVSSAKFSLDINTSYNTNIVLNTNNFNII